MQTNDSPDILLFLENGVQKIVLNRPRKKNAITQSMYAQLSTILRDAAQDNNVHMVVLTGSGLFFTSGNDMSLVIDQGTDDESPITCFKNFVDSLIEFPKLLVAIVNGPAIGIGVTILPLFDLVYASNTAYFYTPFTNLGIIAEGCSTYTFPRIMGNSKAGDMLYMGYRMNALEAKNCGLISNVFEVAHIADVWTYLNKVSTLSQESIIAIKRLVRRWNENLLREVNAEEVKTLAKRWESPEVLERIMRIISRKSKM